MMHKKWMAAMAACLICVSFSSFANEGPDYAAGAVDSSGETAVPFAAAVKQNGKWGAVDGSGKTIIPVSYDKVGVSLSDPDVKDNDLDSEPGRDNLLEVQQGKLRGFYNREGKEIVPVSYETRSIWQEGALAVQKPDKKIVFYKDNGSLISNRAYDQVSDFKNSMAIVKSDGKYGYLSLSGNEIAPVYQEARYFDDKGLAPVRDKGRWGGIDKDGTVVVTPRYKEAGPSFSDGLLAVEDNKNRWGFIDGAGNEVVAPVYKSVVPVFTEGYTSVEDDSKLWGFINDKGEVTAKPQFKAVLTAFAEGLAGVKTIDGNGYAKPDGTMAFMANYDKLYPFEDDIAEVRIGETVETTAVRPFPISIGIGWGWGHWFHHHHHYHHPWGWGIGFPVWDPWYYDYETVPTVRVKRGYINKEGKVIASPSNDQVFKMDDKGVLIRNNGKYGWVDRNGQFIAHIEYASLLPGSEDSVLLARNGDKKWGILSMTDGSTLVPFDYDEIYYVQKGLYGYKEKGRWGLMTRDGARVTEPLYLALSKGGDGLVPVKTKDGWKYVTADGKDGITFQDEATDVTPFHEGHAGVKVKGKWGIIDINGHFLVKPVYDDLDIL